MFDFIFSENFLVYSIAYSIPIFFAAFAALISRKSGTLSINIEGSMTVAAVVGALVSHFSQSWPLGLAAGIVASIATMMILAFASMNLKTDTFLTGISLNTMASGLAVLILYLSTGEKGTSANFPSATIPDIFIPGLSQIPFIGKALFGQNILFYLGLICLFAIWFILEKTKLGIDIKAVGFNPEAAASVGISVIKTRYKSLALAGLFAGFGGCFLSMANLSFFSAGMVAGRGFIGIAAEAMGGGNPFLALLFSYLFGAVDYFAVGAQTVLNIPYQLLNTLPYAMTMIALVIYAVIQNRKDQKKGRIKHEGQTN
jgi:general nucleoside transport system permease protein